MTNQETYLKVLRDTSQVQVGAFLVAMSTGREWLVEYHGYLIATFRYEFQEEAVAFADSLNEVDVEATLKLNWQSEWDSIPISGGPILSERR